MSKHPQAANLIAAPAARIGPARVAAFEILERVAATSDHSDDLLHGRRLAALSQQDRNLATALVLGVLRWQIALDGRIRPLLQRPEIVPAQPVLTALRLGAFQLLHLDRIPAHAALSESVELVRAAGHAHAAGMVNAILRKLTRMPSPAQKLHESTVVFAERFAHPLWLVERWVANYGRAAATALCQYDQHEPPVGSLFQDSAADPTLHGPALDDGSRLVAELTAACVPAATRIWDCCAAPGGKTQWLARRHPEAEILATDVSPKRLAALESRLKRKAELARIRCLEADARTLPSSEGDFELILCDVPCSGTGTLARNPEIRHHVRPSDLPRQAARQRELLTAALLRLSPGGRLVYSTCSMEPEENEQVVEAVLADLPSSSSFHGLDLTSVLQQLKAQQILGGDKTTATLTHEGFLRTLPGSNFAGDGFFAAMFEREGPLAS